MIKEHLQLWADTLALDPDCHPNRMAELNNLKACIDESRHSLRSAIKCYERLDELQKNPDSWGNHNHLRVVVS